MAPAIAVTGLCHWAPDRVAAYGQHLADLVVRSAWHYRRIFTRLWEWADD
ncbi:hypothetical protein [Aurantiacibacter poecillastricola]|nr:hypothetical protein [Aurantiacibacter sp. 219JJ12-13]MDP5263332.1 hypothetical protein [Aurantiacibacter sp. 219JJ12-13]